MATSSLKTVLRPLVLTRWLGLSPRADHSSPARIAPVMLSGAAVISLAVVAVPVSYLQTLSSAGALLYSTVRYLFDRSTLHQLLRTFQQLDDLSGGVRYGFRWSFLLSVLQAVFKLIVCYYEGLTLSHILLFMHLLKQEEIHILFYVLRCQSELMKEGDVQRYRLVSRALSDLRQYVTVELQVSAFLCILWSIETTFLAIMSSLKIFHWSPVPRIMYLFECASYWMSFFFTMGSLAAMVAGYKRIEEQKEEFEEVLYWSLVSSLHNQNTIAKHVMLFQVSTRNEERFQIDYKLIYSVISSTLTFLVILLQFEAGNVICKAQI